MSNERRYVVIIYRASSDFSFRIILNKKELESFLVKRDVCDGTGQKFIEVDGQVDEIQGSRLRLSLPVDDIGPVSYWEAK